MITKVVNANLHQPIYERLTAKQGDIASRYLLFHLLDGDKPFDLTNRSVRVYARKPDKTEIFNDLIINDRTKGYCTLELTSQCLASAGVVKMELYISESGKVLTSIPFELEVIPCINTVDGVTSTNEFSALEAALGSLQDFDNLKREIVEARKTYETVGKRLDNFHSQLDEKSNITDRRRLVTNEVLNNALCTFIIDDGNRAFDTEYKPIFDKYKVKCTHAIVPEWVGNRSEFYTLNELKMLQKEGYDIVGHSYSHDVMFKTENILNTSYKDIDEDFKKCHEYLIKNGFNGYDTIVFPYGYYETREKEIKNIARKYFDNGVGNTNIMKNDEPLDNMLINRKFIRSDDTFDSIKLLIDDAILEKKWFILSLHLDGQCSPDLLDEIIAYIISKDIRILPFTQANELKGNVLSVGEYSSEKYFQVSRSGKVNASLGIEVITFKESRKNNIDETPLIYKDNSVTTFSIEPSVDTVTGLGGTISVYRTGADDFIYQLYTPYTKNDLYLRHWDNRSNPMGWREWSKLNPDNKIEADINSFVLANDWTVFDVRTRVTKTKNTIKANICIENPNRTGSYSKDEYVLTIPNFANSNEYKQYMQSGVMVSNDEYKMFYYLVETNSKDIKIKMLDEHLETDIRWLHFNFTI